MAIAVRKPWKVKAGPSRDAGGRPQNNNYRHNPHSSNNTHKHRPSHMTKTFKISGHRQHQVQRNGFIGGPKGSGTASAIPSHSKALTSTEKKTEDKPTFESLLGASTTSDVLARRIAFHKSTMITTGYKSGGGAPGLSSNPKLHFKRPHSMIASDGLELPPDDRALVKEELVQEFLVWKKAMKIGPGLYNLGNTCFLNSVLQCLVYTPPLCQYLLVKGKETVPADTTGGFDMLKLLAHHVLKTFSAAGSNPIAPKAIATNIRALGRQFRIGRQEDAHEFLRCVIDGMQKSCLRSARLKESAGRVTETTIVHRVFGGYLRSQVRCTLCPYASNKFDPMLDLCLEIRKGIDSVYQALKHYTSVETLDEDNKWKCDGCNRRVRAKKQLTIRKAPNVLTIQLKRFAYGPYGGKINKHVSFKETLNVSEFISDGKETAAACQYQLYSVLVHYGHSTSSGHYYAFVRNSTGTWHRMDDSSVTRVSLDTVLSQHAYILFYVRTPLAKAKPTSTPSVSTAVLSKPKEQQSVRREADEDKRQSVTKAEATVESLFRSMKEAPSDVAGQAKDLPKEEKPLTTNRGDDEANGSNPDLASFVTEWKKSSGASKSKIFGSEEPQEGGDDLGEKVESKRRPQSLPQPVQKPASNAFSSSEADEDEEDRRVNGTSPTPSDTLSPETVQKVSTFDVDVTRKMSPRRQDLVDLCRLRRGSTAGHRPLFFSRLNRLYLGSKLANSITLSAKVRGKRAVTRNLGDAFGSSCGASGGKQAEKAEEEEHSIPKANFQHVTPALDRQGPKQAGSLEKSVITRDKEGKIVLTGNKRKGVWVPDRDFGGNGLLGRSVNQWVDEDNEVEPEQKQQQLEHNRLLREAIRAEKARQREAKLDEWDTALDTGKMKKVKERAQGDKFAQASGASNPFQKVAEEKHQAKERAKLIINS